MMGRSHCVSGIAAGLALAPALGFTTFTTAAPFVLVTAGCAILPDLDHPSSTVTRSLGPLTGALCAVLRGCSAWLYARTKGPRDEPEGTHRHLSHTAIFAALLGLVTGLAGHLVPWSVLGFAVCGVSLTTLAVGSGSRKVGRKAVRCLPRRHKLLRGLVRWSVGNWPLLVGGVAGTAWAAQQQWDPVAIHTHLAGISWRIGVAVAAGCLTHCLGDSITSSGCPWLFPLPIAGETWYELRPPRWLRFHTGGRAETCVLVALVIACVLLMQPYITLTQGAPTL